MAEIRLYNTLTRSKDRFTPIDPANVRVYACGPTVYDYAHIGNARPAIVFDLLFRLLRQTYGADHVTYVRNVTDVDDKIIARARETYPGTPLNDAIREITTRTYAQYARDVAALGCLTPTYEPRATESISEMLDMIGVLVRKGHAYAAEGHVLFDVKSWKKNGKLEYGKLSNRSLDDMIAGARVEVAPYKRDPMDFVMWKPSGSDEPGWDSEWGRGRPGWHIECSAMAAKFLGETFDIHGGGIDLSFPHHENELAQSRCAHDTEIMAQVWMHNGFLQVEGDKMSKSVGNFITIHELLETEKFGGRKWPGEVLRLAMLMTHYREPIDFTVARVEEAEEKLRDWQRATQGEAPGVVDASMIGELSDDLGFHRASVVLDAIARKANRGTKTAATCLAASLEFLGFGSQSLLKAQEVSGVDVEAAVASRLVSLRAKNFAEADRIRAELAAQGVQLMDYKDPATGERRTRWEARR